MLNDLGSPRFTTVVLSILLTGTVLIHNAFAAWMSVDGPYLSQDGYQVEMPAGWMLRTPIEDELFITRDGIWLQFVRVARSRLDRVAPSHKSKIPVDLNPLHVAEIIASEFRANASIVNFQVAEALPIQIDGHAGFRMVFHYTTKQEMKKSGIFYGAIYGDSMYFVHYDAPSRHYFERYRTTIERMKDSFRINP